MITRSRLFEFLVIGGGPAGSAAALALAKRGREVVVVERSDYLSPRIGETLPSVARTVLARLGLNIESASFGHLRCPGTVSVWGSDIPYFNDSLFDPDGDGLHIDRANFDVSLVNRAKGAGATVLTCAEVRSCRRDGLHWDVALSLGDGLQHLQALTLIDAAGRKTWPSRPARRWAFDRQVAMVNIFKLEEGSPVQDEHRTWIEAASSGWWYSSALPDNQLVVAYFTDADLLRASLRRRDERWAELLGEARWTRDRLQRAIPLAGLRVVSASSTISLPIAAPGYVAVGDAASTIDPLSSHGIIYAITSGLDAVDALLDADTPRAIAHYSRTIAVRFCNDLLIRRQFCRTEHRWPNSEFWQRRSGLAPDFRLMLAEMQEPVAYPQSVQQEKGAIWSVRPSRAAQRLAVDSNVPHLEERIWTPPLCRLLEKTHWPSP